MSLAYAGTVASAGPTRHRPKVGWSGPPCVSHVPARRWPDGRAVASGPIAQRKNERPKCTTCLRPGADEGATFIQPSRCFLLRLLSDTSAGRHTMALLSSGQSHRAPDSLDLMRAPRSVAADSGAPSIRRIGRRVATLIH